MSLTFPFKAPAIRVQQPLGTFYVTVLPAEMLLRVTFSDQLSATLNDDGIGYQLRGTQRARKAPRLTEIAKYLARNDSAFPNSIIIAANYDPNLEFDQDEANAIGADDVDVEPALSEWRIEEDGNCSTLHIPTDMRLATVIDGQHRLYAFADPGASLERLEMDLICAVFLELPKPFQAQIFATINSTQKPVDRSLTFDLFGYNIGAEDEDKWTPDKLAVYLTRRLATEPGSPMRGKITVAPKQDKALSKIADTSDWKVSTAVIVDGILRLITTNPKRDSNIMHTPHSKKRAVLKGIRDSSPLRTMYITENDFFIHKLVESYLTACNEVFWKNAKEESFIRRTVGVQALFDILRKNIVPVALERKDMSSGFFEHVLEQAGAIDFSELPFKSPSGSGRISIRKALEERLQF